MRDYKEAVAASRKAIAFLERRQRDDGSMTTEKDEVSWNIACYYKSIWAFESGGKLSRANALADVIKKSIQRRNGDFGDDEQRKGDEWFEWRYYTYPNFWIIMGAQKIGRFDLSMPGISYLLRYLDHNTGGFCNEAPYPRGATVEDSISTAAGGLACLYTGRVGEALKAGDFLVKLLKLQPDLKNKLYTAVNAEKGLIRDFSTTDAIYRVVDTQEKEQYYFMVGLPMALLSKLYLATSDRKYISAAKEYFQFTARCQRYAYSFPASGKSGFGSAILARVTRSRQVTAAAQRQLDFLVRTQAPGGSWRSFPGLKLYGDGALFPIAGQIDITGEFAVWINEAVQELAW